MKTPHVVVRKTIQLTPSCSVRTDRWTDLTKLIFLVGRDSGEETRQCTSDILNMNASDIQTTAH